VRYRPGTVPVYGVPGSAVHRERTLAQTTNFDGFHALVLHPIQGTPLRSLFTITEMIALSVK